MSLKQFLKSKSFFIQLCFVVGTVLILLLGTISFLHFYTRHGQRLTVPYLKGVPIDKAIDILEDKGLKYKVTDTLSYNEMYAKLAIMEQNPGYGSFVKKDRTVYLRINASGYKYINVPDIIGKTKREAIEILKSKGFKVGNILYATYFAKDVVLRLMYDKVLINQGEEIQENSEIDLIVGDGRGTYRN